MKPTTDAQGMIPSWAVAEAFRRLEVARLATEREREARAARWRKRVERIKTTLTGGVR